MAVGGVGVMVGGIGVEQNRFTTPSMERTITILKEDFIPALAFEINEGYITFILLLFYWGGGKTKTLDFGSFDEGVEKRKPSE